jgi:chromosome segregation ATPase
LQLIQKFGNDASNGLAQAKAENAKLLKDLSEQKQQHKEVMNDQNNQQSQMRAQLADLEKSLKMLKTDLEAKQSAHKTAMLQKQEMLQQTLNDLQPQKVSTGITSGSPRRKDEMTEQRHNLGLL